ncbi:MAG: hypothetical protein Q8Q37_00600 [bacterium]|nr:hypothetical protein [bacterium]
MLKNWNHDLVHQLSETSDGLWRIEDYIKNSQGCDHCIKMWNEVKDNLEKISESLVEEIGRHYQENRFE